MYKPSQNNTLVKNSPISGIALMECDICLKIFLA